MSYGNGATRRRGFARVQRDVRASERHDGQRCTHCDVVRSAAGDTLCNDGGMHHWGTA